MIEYILIPDGSSDRLLFHPIDWLFRSKGFISKGVRIDFNQLGFQPKSLADRIKIASSAYPDISLFILHRDTENQTSEIREIEVLKEIVDSGVQGINSLKVIPIRMSEAWILFDETAIRKASGKPSGQVKLNLPSIGRLEKVADPKELLKTNLLLASETRGRKRAQFDYNEGRQLVAEYIQDYSLLRRLAAFQRFENEVDQYLSNR